MQEKLFRQTVKMFLASMAVLFCASSLAFAQSEVVQDGLDELPPPPVIVLSSAEQQQLSAETDLKRRTALCLQLADLRLKRAEELAVGNNFEAALVELGGYQAVIQNGLSFLRQNNNDSKRARDNFKRMELAIRAHVPRIETIRRTTPFEYALQMKPVMNFARDARTSALEAFFSDSVVEDAPAVAPAAPAKPVLKGAETTFTSTQTTEKKP